MMNWAVFPYWGWPMDWSKGDQKIHGNDGEFTRKMSLNSGRDTVHPAGLRKDIMLFTQKEGTYTLCCRSVYIRERSGWITMWIIQPIQHKAVLVLFLLLTHHQCDGVTLWWGEVTILRPHINIKILIPHVQSGCQCGHECLEALEIKPWT